ncbi:hypothetical protein [Acinetobacter pittii]|uniref:hypothetical protein n=1 Tax=Acinetobacter pittii TaxID=48296 RepID=UPI00355B2CCE
MDKCREDLEAKFANSPELKEGHITWWEESHSYVAKTQDFQESADYWNQILNAWQLRQPDIDLLEAKVEELKATIKGNHGRIAELERLNRVKAQAIIDLHQEITELKASHHGEVIGHEVHFKKIKQERDELQKRVQFLEQELGAWKGKSIAAMINGMCKQCGKEPWQAIVSDKDGYALLHCFGCGANKYELVGEQALKGEG